MRFRHVERGGRHFRVADPDWKRPLDGAHSREGGARWNAPGSFPVVYLCSTVAVARANVLRKHRGLPYSVLDLRPKRRPVLVETGVTSARFVDVVSDAGCVAAGLPKTYPRDTDGAVIGWDRCRPVGQTAWDQSEPGIACRSAAARPRDEGEELAWFQREERLRSLGRRSFDEWFP